VTGIRQREGLIARVRQIRRAAAATEQLTTTTEEDRPEATTLQLLEARIAHLEEQLDGLQDSVHRESVRQSDRIGILEARIEPSALAVALSRDARERGL
jgi:uncharacterized protein Yka (UPF0111/DUF47 family)